MTLDQLRYFIETARTLHFTKAAEQLNISQPSLSYALSQLSKSLGVPLFVKEGIKISLTEYGEAFLPYAESAINILSQGEIQLNKMQDPANGNINLGYIYSVSFGALPQLIEEFYAYLGSRNINFNFQVNTTNVLIKKLLEGYLDVVMAPFAELSNEYIESIPLFKQELFLIVNKSHPLAKNKEVKVQDIRNERLIMIKKETDLFYQTNLLFNRYNITPNIYFEVDECNSMASFVGAQLGVAIMPRIPALDSYNVIPIPFAEEHVYRTISIFWNSNIRPKPVLKSFLEYCISAKSD